MTVSYLFLPIHSSSATSPDSLRSLPPAPVFLNQSPPASSETMCHKFSSHYFALSHTFLQSVRLYLSLIHLSTNILRFSQYLIFNPASSSIATFSFLVIERGSTVKNI